MGLLANQYQSLHDCVSLPQAKHSKQITWQPAARQNRTLFFHFICDFSGRGSPLCFATLCTLSRGGVPPHELDKTSSGQVLTAAGHLQRAGARFREVQKKCEEFCRISNSKSMKTGPGLSHGELEPMVVHWLFWMPVMARCCVSWHAEAWFGVQQK